MRRTPRSRLALAAAALALVGATSCAPETPPAPEPPQASAVLSPSSGPAGSFVNVAAPNGACSQNYSSLQAALTIPRTGVVVTQAYQYIGPSPSTYSATDQFVRLRIPPATAAGTYNVFLSCYSYLDTYSFAPAKFTVTSSGL